MAPPKGSSSAAATNRGVVHLPAFADQEQVRVSCNGVPGVMLVSDKLFVCRCGACLRREAKVSSSGHPGQRHASSTFTPTEFERHAGMAASKKWKYSVRVDDPAHNPADGSILTIGRWLDDRGHTHRKIQTGRSRPGITVSKDAGGGGRDGAAAPVVSAVHQIDRSVSFGARASALSAAREGGGGVEQAGGPRPRSPRGFGFGSRKRGGGKEGGADGGRKPVAEKVRVQPSSL